MNLLLATKDCSLRLTPMGKDLGAKADKTSLQFPPRLVVDQEYSIGPNNLRL